MAIPTSVGLGLEDLLHVNNNNNEIPEKTTTELTTVNPCHNQDQDNKSIIIEKVGKYVERKKCKISKYEK